MTEKKKRAKRTPEQRLAMKYAYWNKWCPGADPEKVLRSKGITNDEWYISDITNVTNTTPSKLDQHYEREYNITMIKQRKRTREEQQRILELRWGSRSSKHKNKKKYDRKNQDWKKDA